MDTLAFLSQLLLLGLGIFLMIVILLQRGRGGGLAGAFGGLGGQSAFGTKAGDVFTRITIVMAVAWVIVSGGSGYFLRAAGQGLRAKGLGEVSSPELTAPAEEGAAENGLGAAPADSSGTGSDAATTSEAGEATTTPPADAAGQDGAAPAAESSDTPAEPDTGQPGE